MPSALLIPSYEPKERVVDFLSLFEEGDFDYFLVVDDGSGEDYSKIFDQIKEKTVFEVISYGKNRGKGSALKHGLRYLLQEHPDVDLLVTADSDGQHLRKDILRVKEAGIAHPDRLVLGSRDFEHAPPKSKGGNLWSSRYFFLLTGAHIKDTQTGLRGIPSCLFELFLETHGSRFDFEMHFLLDAATVLGLEQLEIETIYENGKNEGTHYRPVLDSLRIANSLIVYVLAFALFITLNIGFYSLFARLFEPVTFNFVDLLLAGMKTHACALGIAGAVIYPILHFAVFSSKVPLWKSLLKNTLVLLCFYVFEVMLSLLTPTFGYPVTWLIAVATPLFAILKAFANLRYIFALKRIHK